MKKERWFELHNSVLFYFSDPSDVEALGVLDIRGAEIHAVEEKGYAVCYLAVTIA